MLVRVAAAKIVAGTLQGVSLATSLPQISQKVSVQDQALLSELCYGSLRQYSAICQIVAYLLDKPLRKKERDIQALLICAIYQLTSTRIPPHAVINESVVACEKLKRPWAKALVNAALRRFLREREKIETLFINDEEYTLAHPRWLIDLLGQAWPDRKNAIMVANNHRAPMTLRVNVLRLGRDEYLAKYFSADSAAATIYSDAGIQLGQPVTVSLLPGFSEGLISVQDEAAQLAALLLNAQIGDRVLDACCAPGGKTSHILETAPRLKELVSIDIDPLRLAKVQENLTRLKLSATLVNADVAATDSWWDGALFDRILLDVPCSATGVIRRHPDIKLLRKPEDIDKLAEQQLTMLLKIWPMLKSGGRLLYATCSVLPQENDAVIERFSVSTKDARLVDVNILAGVATDFGRQLFPKLEGHDGFYYAMLEKS
jgi:16S rRNA (cytosine967-C5)-methyltransferase